MENSKKFEVVEASINDFHTAIREGCTTVAAVVQQSGIQNGLVSVYAQGATAAMMIQENWDDSVQTDVVH